MYIHVHDTNFDRIKDIDCIWAYFYLVSTSLGKLGQLVGTELLRDDLLDLLGREDDRGTSLGSSNQVRAVESTNELVLQSSSNTAAVGSFEVAGLGQRTGNLVGTDIGRLVTDGQSILSGSNIQSLYERDNYLRHQPDAGYLVLGESGILVRMLSGQVEGLGAESASVTLDQTAVIVADEFPLKIDRH